MRRASVIIALGLLAGICTGCVGPDDIYRSRITVTVEVAGKTYTASGVIQVEYVRQPNIGVSTIPKATGDAIVLEVPGQSPIFFLLSDSRDSGWAKGIAYEVFKERLPEPRRGIDSIENIKVIASQNERVEIPRERYPTIVAFRDVTKPASVYELLPNDLSPAIGADSHVAKIMLEMTRDPVTYGVGVRLPWLGYQIKARLDGSRTHSAKGAFANSLGVSDFVKRGI